MNFYTSNGHLITSDITPLASAGGEGTVYKIINSYIYNNHCIKIYHRAKRTIQKKKKLEFMIQNKVSSLSGPYHIFCWPQELIFDENNNFIGYIMSLAFIGSEKLYELTTLKTSPKMRIGWNKFDRSSITGMKNRFKLCCNLAKPAAIIHFTEYFSFIDFKPQNVLITDDGKISITDVDSFQISASGTIMHSGEVVTPEYAPPESNALNPSTSFIPKSWDQFSFAVTLYEILFGIHPYAATCNGQYSNATTISDKIKNGLFVHGSKRTLMTVIPAIHNRYDDVSSTIKNLFLKAFDSGHHNPANRPTPDEWYNAFQNEV